MKLVATGMLVAMALLFIAARSLAETYVWAGFVEAFAEAAMVGGLADWFAVTALFRHPLGLPIPHTAIIPRNKDRLGDNLANFLKTNFLKPRIVARRLQALDLAGAVGRWLASPPEQGRLRGSIGRLGLQLLDALDNEAVGGWIRGALSGNLRRLEVAPLLGRLLDRSIDDGRLQPLVDSGITWCARVLDQNEGLIRDLVEARTMWLLRLASIDERLANSIIEALRKLLNEMAADEAHPLRQKVMVGLKDLAFDLQFQSETQHRVERLKLEMIENPELGHFLDGVWSNAKTSLRRSLADPDQALAGRLGEAARHVGETIESDPALQAALNKYARRAIVGVVADYGDELVRIVSDTVRGWDAGTVTDRVEYAVGRDLQFIRVNGTLVGGLVGLAIHTATVLL
jgi:uncharacterized membrane-anchored protein YjiN (DUF445 family)